MINTAHVVKCDMTKYFCANKIHTRIESKKNKRLDKLLLDRQIAKNVICTRDFHSIEFNSLISNTSILLTSKCLDIQSNAHAS